MIFLLCVLLCVLSFQALLVMMEHATPEKIEISLAIHPPFHQLESIHLPLNRTIPPNEGSSCTSCIFVLLHSIDEGLKSWEMTGFHCVQPFLTLFSIELTHHGETFLNHLRGRFHVGARLPQLLEVFLLLCFHIFFCAEKEPGSLGSGESQKRVGQAFGL
jgi:hypothetical protein